MTAMHTNVTAPLRIASATSAPAEARRAPGDASTSEEATAARRPRRAPALSSAEVGRVGPPARALRDAADDADPDDAKAGLQHQPAMHGAGEPPRDDRRRP